LIVRLATIARKNSASARSNAACGAICPDGIGRSGWFTRSTSRSYTSFSALPAPVKKKTARPPRAMVVARATVPPAPTATTLPMPTAAADMRAFTGRRRRTRAFTGAHTSFRGLRAFGPARATGTLK
jgi:hypothetical protein